MTDRIKPLHVPANFDVQASFQDRVVFALAYLGEGSAEDVSDKLIALDDAQRTAYAPDKVSEVLEKLYEAGLINGEQHEGKNYYNLHKMTRPHTGKVDPENLQF